MRHARFACRCAGISISRLGPALIRHYTGRTDRFPIGFFQAEVTMNRCQPVALGIAIGVLWAIYVFCVGITAMFGWGVALVNVLASLYIGLSASILGAIIGAIWAFVDGFVAGLIIAWVYNLVAGEA